MGPRYRLSGQASARFYCYQNFAPTELDKETLARFLFSLVFLHEGPG
jgi:hypothetical protein